MSRILDRMHTFIENLFGKTFDNRYILLSVGYLILCISQFFIYLADAFRFLTRTNTELEKFDSFLLIISFFVFSFFYAFIFILVEPENRRIFGACGILASVQLVLSTIYYLYILLSTDLNDSLQVFYYTIRFAPISIICITFLSVISVWVMCKMSFFRPNTKGITDLYEVEEKKEKKAD